jgi:hypothetical protein
MIIIFIYFQFIRSFIILNIIKEKTIKPINIININKLIFSLNIYYKDFIIFIISLYEINKILKNYKEKEKELF